jgi:predicted PurR-regulated permease PerM
MPDAHETSHPVIGDGPRPDHERRIGSAITILAVLAVLYTLYFAGSIVLPFALAIVLNLLLSPLMRVLHVRLKVPRTLGALLLILVLIGVVGGIGAAISVPASGWIARAPDTIPILEKRLSFLREPIDMAQKGYKRIEGLMASTGDTQAPQPAPAQAPATDAMPGLSGLSSVGGAILLRTGAVLGKTFTVLLLLFFLLSSGDTLLRRFIEILPKFADKRRAVQIASEIEHNVSSYLATITMMNILVGLAAGGAMFALGLPDPLLWGTLAFLLNYVPIIGPVTGIVCFFVIGLFSYDNPLSAFAPAGIYLAIHLLEGETITPMLLARRLTLNPVLVIASLLFWDWMWGIPGALLSVPLLAVFKIVCDHLPHLAPLGHMLGAEKASHEKKPHEKTA